MWDTVAQGAAADSSWRLNEMHQYAWEFMAFDDQEVGVPAPHNSALARTYVCVRSWTQDRSRTAIGPTASASRVKAGRMKMSGLTH